MGDVIKFPIGGPVDGVRLPAQAASGPLGLRDQVAAIVRAETGCTAERADFVAARVMRAIETRP